MKYEIKLLRRTKGIIGKKNSQKEKNKNNKFKNLRIFIKIDIIIILLFIYFVYFLIIENNESNNIKIGNIKDANIKVALCTMGKKENLYIKEFVDYYIKLGVNHLFIYDHNDPNTEKMSDVINNTYEKYVTIYENRDLIRSQSAAFTNCYHTHMTKFNWFIMFDMDEYLYIVNDTLKNYLSNSVFDKCDFIKLHWVLPTDNNLLHYDPRPLFVRFKGPYVKYMFIKSIIRGNISDLKYWVHSPFISPTRNITCNNEGKKIFYKNINFELLKPINTNKAYIIHYRYKSTEEFINKYKRGYSNWFGNRIGSFLENCIKDYFHDNEITLEKINYMEKELKIDLYKYKLKLKFKTK